MSLNDFKKQRILKFFFFFFLKGNINSEGHGETKGRDLFGTIFNWD